MKKAPLQTYASALVFSPRESQIRKANLAHYPTWFKNGPDVEDQWGPTLQMLQDHGDPIESVTFSFDGKYLASLSTTSELLLWNATTGTLHSTLSKGDGQEITSITFSRNGQLASASSHGEVRVWDLVTGVTCRRLVHDKRTPIIAVAFAPDGTLAISYQNENKLIWIYKAGAPRALVDPTFYAYKMAFLSQGVLALVCADSRSKRGGRGEILLHDPETHVQRCIPIDSFSRATFSSNDQLALWMYGMDTNDLIHVYDLTTNSYLSLRLGISLVSALEFSFSNKCLIASCYNGSMYSWDLESRTETFIGTCSNCPTSIAPSPDGKLAIASRYAKGIRLWEVAARSPSPKSNEAIDSAFTKVKRLLIPSKKASPSSENIVSTPTKSIVFSRDGKQLASASRDTIKVLDPATMQEIHVLQSEIVASITISGNYVASGHLSGTTHVWDLASGKILKTLRGHLNTVRLVALSPKNRILASMGYDGILKVWDSRTWDLQRTQSVRESDWGSLASSIAFSQNGKRFAVLYVELVAILDAEKYICLQRLRVRFPEYSLFDNQISYFAESCIETTYDRILLDLPFGSTSNEPKTLLNRWRIDDNWLIRDGRKMLWLPPDFQPSCTATYHDLLVLGHNSGNLTFFEGNIDKGTLN